MKVEQPDETSDSDSETGSDSEIGSDSETGLGSEIGSGSATESLPSSSGATYSLRERRKFYNCFHRIDV